MPAIIKFTIVQPQGINQREHAKLMRDANRKTMTNHRDKRLGKHYQVNAETTPGGAYGYEKRSAKWTNKKLIKKGHKRPNYYTGFMARTIRNNSRITATQTRARMIARHVRPMKDQQRREIEAISDAEKQEIIEENAANYFGPMNRLYMRKLAKKTR